MPSLRLASALRSARGKGIEVEFWAAQALGLESEQRRHWGRITISRSETRAQTPIPERRARRVFFEIMWKTSPFSHTRSAAGFGQELPLGKRVRATVQGCKRL